MRRPAKAQSAWSNAAASRSATPCSCANSASATDPLDAAAERHRGDGATVIFVAIDGKLAGLIAIADPIKATTAEALRALKADGIAIVMLTGDNRTTARAVARSLGIDDVEAEVLPERKADVVAARRRAGHVVAMAGDGVNDAPALAAADVGIAMGTGTDVAIESAGVTLVKGDLTGIARTRRLSAATMRNIRQNLLFAFIYNAAGVPIAAGVLYPVFGIVLTPAIARRGHGVVVGQRGDECAAAAARGALINARRCRSGNSMAASDRISFRRRRAAAGASRSGSARIRAYRRSPRSPCPLSPRSP